MNLIPNRKRSLDVDEAREAFPPLDDQNLQDLGAAHRQLAMSDDLRKRLNKVVVCESIPPSEKSPAQPAIPALWLGGAAASVLLVLCAIGIYLSQIGNPDVDDRADRNPASTREADDVEDRNTEQVGDSLEEQQRRDQIAEQELRHLQLQAEIRQLELEIELSQQVTQRLTSPRPVDPIKSARFRLDADRYHTTQLQVLGATMISLADFDRELGLATDSVRESYSRIIRMFPETEWADVARQRLEDSF